MAEYTLLDGSVISDKDIEREAAEFESGAWEGGLADVKPGPAYGRGRHLLFGETMKQVGFKEPESVIAAIDARCDQLGLKRSDYLRRLVEEDLKLAGIA